MEIVDLELFKKHVRADDFADDDDKLEAILRSAECEVITATNRTYDELLGMGNGDFPAPLKQAIMMVGAMKYAYPEGIVPSSYGHIPFGPMAIIKQYRKLGSDAGG